MITKKSLLLIFINVFAVITVFGQTKSFTYNDSWGAKGMSLVNSKTSDVTINFSIQDFALTEQSIGKDLMKTIEIFGSLLPNNEGAPDLPGYAKYVAVPNGAKAKLEIIKVRKEIIKNVELAPAPDIPFVQDKTPLKYEKDPEIYSKDEFYPKNPIQISKKSTIRGVEYVTLGITPFQYNPVTKELIVYRDIEVRVNFEGGKAKFGDDRLRNRWFDPILNSTIINSNSLPEIDYEAKSASKATGYEYLIIVPDNADFIAWADTIKQFRTLQGIKTGVVTITDIGSNSVSSIKSYIDNAYNNWDIPPVAVLIMADYGTSGVGITSQSYSHPYQGTYITDNYYADVVNNDGLPDIVFARMTAQDVTDLETMVTKFINYEKNPPTATNFYNNPITACGWQTERWFQLCSEIVGGYLKNEHGKSPVRINAVYSGTPGSSWSTATNTSDVVNYFGPNGLGYIPASPSTLGGWTGGDANDVINAINSGAFMLQHRDHGAYYGWGEPAFQNTHISSLTNTDLPFIFSLNCLTGQYDYSSECFAEKFHRYTYNGNNSGALGLIAATQVSYSFVNDCFAWGMYDYMWPDFMPDYNSTNLNTTPATLLPGFANVSGKYFLAQSSWPYNTSDKAITYNLFHLHGDAFTMLYSEVPQNLTVSHANELPSGTTSFSVTANSGSYIALTANGEILSTALGTGSSVAITIPAQTVGTDVTVTITKQNYYRYSSTIPVTGTVTAPVAEFSANVTTIYEGESVTFTDQSTNSPTSWSWSFSGATPSTSNNQNQSVVYNTAGTYQVSLTVSNSAGSDTETKTNYITVQIAPPVAEFSADATTIYEGETINFTDASTGNPTSWAWTFDGATPASSTDQNPSVTYITAGTYNVVLTATNAQGSDAETKTAYITVNPPVVCTDLPYAESFENTIGDWVQAGDDDMDWTVHSGSTGSSSTGPSSAYDGTYYIYMEASSPNYPTKTANLTSSCFDLSNASNPFIEFQYHMYGSAMGTLNIQISTDDGASWTTEWTKSGDQGNSWYLAEVNLGAYVGNSNVLIRLNGITGSSYRSDISIDAFEIKDDVVAPPVADFSASSTTINEGESITFTDASTGDPTSWSWTFNGGTPSTSSNQNPTVSYNTAGTYDVVLTATNSSGSDTETKTAYITVNGVTCAGLPYSESFENTIGDWEQASDDDMDWTVNSGSTGSSSTGPSSAYDGSYYIYMEASSPNYPSKTANLVSQCFDFSSYSAPKINFRYHMYGSAMGTLNIQVSTDNGSTWNTEWTLSGDQGNSWYAAEVNLAAYSGNSNVKIRLNGTTGSSYRSDISVDAFEVTEDIVVAPVAGFSASATTVSSGQTVTFTDQSSYNPTSWSWTFAGGSPSTSSSQNPTISYDTPGVYDVSLTATNGAGNDTETKVGYITVEDAVVTYCDSKSGNYNYEYIGSVQVGTYTNTSAGSYYTDYTSEIIPVTVGTNSVTLTPVFPSSTYSEYWRIWIDFNKNGDFTDSGEEVFAQNSTSVVSGTIDIPTGFSGQTRMRVSMKWNAAPTPCESFSYGEVEDYTVSVGSDFGTELSENIMYDLPEIEKTFEIFPNPAGKVVKLSLLGYGKNIPVKIFDSNGRIVKEYIQTNDIQEININQLKVGIYLIVIQGNSETVTKRFVKK